MELIEQYPNVVAIGSLGVIVLENILPHLPIKANSTLQIIINVAKAIFRKKA